MDAFLTYGFLQRALVAGIFIGQACAVLGVFLLLRKDAMIGHGLSHVAFAGVALGLFLSVLPLIAALLVSVAAALGIMRHKIQAFLLELGHGFCFEARQKRILIGNTFGFVDLVFYHRVLKCHVLVELKVAAFSHEHLGQLNTYVSWYAGNMMNRGDNPPIGILLCTHRITRLSSLPWPA